MSYVPKIGAIQLESVNYSQESIGQVIYHKGYVSGASYGTFRSIVCIESPDDNDVDLICNQGMVENTNIAEGDSGGVVFTVPSGGRLHGTVSGGVQAANTMTYSRAEKIINELSLNGVILY